MIPCCAWLLLSIGLCLLPAFPSSAQAQGNPPAVEFKPEQPHDLILAVDVSLSMLMDWSVGQRTFPASDREGMRWDGIQFAVDVARPQDRVALVLYRAENIVLSKYVDASGFVSLSKKYPEFGGKTGRELLTALITEIQQEEAAWGKKLKALQAAGKEPTGDTYRALTFQLLKDGAGATVPLAHGTASMLALKTIAQELLPQVRPGAQGWTFLFTDGVEVGPVVDGKQFTVADFAYIREREKLKVPKLADWVAPWMKEFRQRGVPVYTFALGDDCDWSLLRAIAQQSTKAGAQERAAASYELKNNVQLLDTLQHIQWELREYWKRPLEPDRRDEQQEIFSTPKVQFWGDLGVLLYRSVAGDVRARAPVAGHMKTPRVGDRELAWLKPLVSRSHWYYHLMPSDKEDNQAALAGELELQVRHTGDEQYVTRAVAAFRTQQSLFRFVQPVADGDKPFTPRDAIPFQVEFTPYAIGEGKEKREVPFQAADFDVEVSFTPVAGKPDKSARTFKLALLPLTNAPDDARLAVRQFRKELVLDDAANSAGHPELTGLYDVDVVITGVKGPLAGARRRLLRRTLLVGPYPALTVPAKIILTNEGPDTARKTIAVELDQRTEVDGVLTDVAAALTRGPIAQKEGIAPAKFLLGTKALRLNGKKGALTLELSAAVWATLPAREFKNGTLEFRVPWQSDPVVTEVIVRKLPYKVSATPDVMRLDLSAHSAKRVAKEIQVVLQTRLATAEPVWLSATDAAEREQPELLTFARVADDKGAALKEPFRTVKLRCEGLGKPQPVHGGEQADKASLSFALTHDGPLPAGVYQRQLYLVGDGIVATPVTVNVVANLVTVRSDRSATPLDEVYLFGLAGADVRQTLQLQTGLGARVRAVRAVADWPRLKNGEAGGWDELTLTSAVSPKTPDQLTLGLKVPLCVQEGRYRAVVELEVVSEEADKAARPLLVSLPVYLEVRHAGVRFQQGKVLDFKGPLRLPSGPLDPCEPFATADFELATDALKAPIRWRVERVAPAAGLGKALAADDGRVDVLFKGRSVLGKGGSGEPIRGDRPGTLTVKATRTGLEPGWYRAALRFHSGEDHAKAAEGPPVDLQLLILVPGRRLESVEAVGDRPTVGGQAGIDCTVACYGCEPGEGEVQLVNAAWRPLAADLPLAQWTRKRPDQGVPDLWHYDFSVRVTPPQPGKNHYQVRWPALCVRKLWGTRIVDVETLSRLEVSQPIAHADEELTIRAFVDPALAPENGRPLVLRAVPRSDNGLSPFDIELFDDGHKDHGDVQAKDGVYSGLHKFTRPGDYDLLFPAAGGVSAVKPVTVRVAFEFRCPEKFGPIEYGGGQLQTWFRLTEEVSEARAIQLANRRSLSLRWRARLVLPTTDPRQHLDTRLLGPGGADAAGWIGGTLRPEEALDLGLESRLSDAARVALAEGGEHPTLGHDNGMVLEVELVWVDDRGKDVDRRDLRVPFTIGTRYWIWNAKPWIAGSVLLVGAFLGWRGLLRWRRNWRDRRASQAALRASAEPVAVQSSTPRSSVPVARVPEPPALTDDDDLLPEHFR